MEAKERIRIKLENNPDILNNSNKLNALLEDELYGSQFSELALRIFQTHDAAEQSLERARKIIDDRLALSEENIATYYQSNIYTIYKQYYPDNEIVEGIRFWKYVIPILLWDRYLVINKNTDYYTKIGFIYLYKSNWDQAYECFYIATKLDDKNAQAHIGYLLTINRVTTIMQLASPTSNAFYTSNFQRACWYADDETREELIKAHNQYRKIKNLL